MSITDKLRDNRGKVCRKHGMYKGEVCAKCEPVASPQAREMQTRILDAAYAQQKRMEVASPQATGEQAVDALAEKIADGIMAKRAAQPAAGTTPRLGTCKLNSSEHTLNTHGPRFPCVSFVPTSEGTTPQAERPPAKAIFSVRLNCYVGMHIGEWTGRELNYEEKNALLLQTDDQQAAEVFFEKVKGAVASMDMKLTAKQWAENLREMAARAVAPVETPELCDHGIPLSEAVSYKCRECWEGTLNGAMEQAERGAAAHIRAGAPFNPCPSIHQPCVICEALLSRAPEQTRLTAEQFVAERLERDPNEPDEEDAWQLRFPNAVEAVTGRDFWVKHLAQLLEAFRDKSEAAAAQPTIEDGTLVLRKIAECEQFSDKLGVLAAFINYTNAGLREEIERLNAQLYGTQDALADDQATLTELRAKLAEQGKPTPDGGALVNPTAQQKEWIAAIEQAECQIESFAPLTLTNIKALRAEAEVAALREREREDQS